MHSRLTCSWRRPQAGRHCLDLVVLALAFFPTQAPAARPRVADRGLFIVAPEALHESLAEFVEHKRRFLPTELVSLEKVLQTVPGVDDPERLKRFLYEAWRQRQLGYALLVGDASAMPVRYMVLDRITPAACNYVFFPSDLYYSALAHADGRFDDWNGRKSGFHGRYFGEVRGEKNKNDPINYDRIHYLPNIAVGRWPVCTPEEVRRVAARSMAYENAVRQGRQPGLRRAAFILPSGWIDVRPQTDRLAAGLPAGWGAAKRYYADRGRNDHTPPPSEDEVVALLNEGVGLVLHAGHGSPGGWQGCFFRRDLRRLHNADQAPVIFSIGCSTAVFAPEAPYTPYVDVNGKEHTGTNKGEVFTVPPPPPAAYQKGHFKPMSVGQELLRVGPGGAAAYIGCTTGSQPCAYTLQEGFMRTLRKARRPRLGDCWAGAIRYYYRKEGLARLVPTESWYPPSVFCQAMKYVVFGDPSLTLP
jgi:hypothetical protein